MFSGVSIILTNGFHSMLNLTLIRLIKTRSTCISWRSAKDLRVPLAESLSDKTNDIVYNVEDVTKRLFFLTSFLFFLEQPKKKWTQTNHNHELFDKQNNLSELRLASETSSQVPSSQFNSLIFFRNRN